MAHVEQHGIEDAARRRAHDFIGLVWHVGAFVIINAYFWMLDLVLGQDGAQWSFWITGAWGFALAFHLLTYLIAGRRLEERKAVQFVRESGGLETDQLETTRR